MSTAHVRLAVALESLCPAVGPAAAADAPAMTLDVDARELPRKLLHTTLDIPCQPGPLRLWYPKWFPGSHGPCRETTDSGTKLLRRSERYWCTLQDRVAGQ
jgi:hypothetical protein